MRTIDADAHVIETPVTFEYMDEADRQFAPVVLTQSGGFQRMANDGKSLHREHWTVDNRIIPKDKLVDSTTPEDAREMRDIDARLRHMDELQVDVQVLYPTMFLRPLTTRPRIAVALAKSYNRWLIDIWKKGKGRLRWVAIPPLLDMSQLDEELAFCKKNGACGIFLNGIEFDKPLASPYFFPLYAAAEKYDLPLCLHAGINSDTVYNFYIDDAFMKFKLSMIDAWHNLVWEGVPQRFPKARWGLIEVSAQWIPYVLKDLEIRFNRRGTPFPKNPLKAFNTYVACQITDDLPMILPYSGEDNLVIGTDYGHSDTSTEIEALRLLKKEGNVAPSIIDKILGDNARVLYGLDA